MYIYIYTYIFVYICIYVFVDLFRLRFREHIVVALLVASVLVGIPSRRIPAGFSLTSMHSCASAYTDHFARSRRYPVGPKLSIAQPSKAPCTAIWRALHKSQKQP